MPQVTAETPRCVRVAQDAGDLRDDHADADGGAEVAEQGEGVGHADGPDPGVRPVERVDGSVAMSSVSIQTVTIQAMTAKAKAGAAWSPVRPTLDTVARAAGVSRMTVSNAYNRPDQLSAATRARVLAVAAELGYGGPDPAGRSLRRGRSGTVGRRPHRPPGPRLQRPGDGLVPPRPGGRARRGAAGAPPAARHRRGRRARWCATPSSTGSSWPASRAAPHVVDEVLGRRLPVVTSGSLELRGVPNVSVDDVGGRARRWPSTSSRSATDGSRS